MPLISFFGPPGSGKGTQSQRLRAHLDMPYLATGDLIRSVGQEDSPLGNQLRAITAANAFVPDELMIEMVMSRIGDDDYILDGFPRTLAQAEAFDQHLERAGRTLTHVFYVHADDETVTERIVGRRLCADCARPYHTTLMPPAVDGVCDACNGELVARSDDTLDKVQQRLDDYRSLTAPLVAYYQGGPLVTVDGNADADVVWDNIIDAL